MSRSTVESIRLHNSDTVVANSHENKYISNLQLNAGIVQINDNV